MLPKLKSPSDSSTLQDNSLLNSLARRYYAPLLSFFRKRTHHGADTQDLVQQVFLRLAQSRQQGQIHNPDACIFQTAANALRDHYRHFAVHNRFLNETIVASDGNASDLNPERSVHRDPWSVIVVVDARPAQEASFDQLAAYIAMVGLAQIRMDAKLGDAPTILQLFSDPKNKRSSGLSPWDRAYLRGLYNTEPSDLTQLLGIARSMAHEVAP